MLLYHLEVLFLDTTSGIGGDNKTVYVAKYVGIAEVWLGASSTFSHRCMFSRGDLADQVIRRMMDQGFGVEREIASSIEKIISNLTDVKERVVNALEEVRGILSDILENGLSGEKLKELAKAVKELKDAFSEFMEEVRERIRMQMSIIKLILGHRFHPFFIPFAALEWKLVGPENITDSEGNVIGISFSFVAEDVKASIFKCFDRIEIRNRIYTVTVNETSGNQTYTVTRAELKNDIIISGYRWNWDNIVRALENKSRHSKS